MTKSRGLRVRAFTLDYEKFALTHKRVCIHCKQEKVINMFYAHDKDAVMVLPTCKTCCKQRAKAWRKNNPEKAKDLDLRKNYGIGLEEKKALLESQGGVCAGCGTDTPGGKYNEWHLDHCHDSKVIRGILCANCNFILGLVKNNSEHLYKLAAYMAKFQHLVN